MQPPATRVIALSNVDSSDAPEELNQLDPAILVEVVLVGLIPDCENIIAIVCMTAEDENKVIQWNTTLPHKQFESLLMMRSIVNLPKNAEGVKTEMTCAPQFGQMSAKERAVKRGLVVSGRAIAKFWKAQMWINFSTTQLTVKHLRKVADLLPDLWKTDAMQLAQKLEEVFFKSPKLKREVITFCNFTADLLETI